MPTAAASMTSNPDRVPALESLAGCGLEGCTEAHTKNKTDREAYNGCCPCGHRDIDQMIRNAECDRRRRPQ